MKVHEYQAKELLESAPGSRSRRGSSSTTPAEAAEAYDALGGGLIVVKAQVHAGGRGKGVAVGPEVDRDRGPRDRQRQASPGPRAWPRACSSSGRPPRPTKAAASLLGKTLVTYQTGAEGQAISKVLVTVGHDIARELYLGLAIDRDLQVPGADGLDRGGRRDRDRRRTRPPRRSTASRSTSASAWPTSRPARSARPSGSRARRPRRGRRSSRTSSSSSSTRTPRSPRSTR